MNDVVWDTNLLVRMVARDDPHQLATIERHLLGLRAQQATATIPLPAILEAFWVLRSLRRQDGSPLFPTRTALVEGLSMALDTVPIVVEDGGAVRAALFAWQAGTADFPELLMAFRALPTGRPVITFDRNALAHPDLGFCAPDSVETFPPRAKRVRNR